MNRVGRVAMGCVLLLSACGNDAVCADCTDSAGVSPSQSTDLATPSVDLATASDLAVGSDSHDFAAHDLSMSPDVAVARDLTVTPDFATPADLTPIDLAAPPDLTPPSSVAISHADWVALCQQLIACKFWEAGATMTSCIAAEPPIGALPWVSPSMLACVLAAGNNCTAVLTCMNGGNAAFTCSSTTTQTTCSGTDVVRCPVDHLTSYDCTTLGETCASAAGNTGCALSSCATWTDTSICSGGLVVTCNGSFASYTNDCRVWQGAQCGATTPGRHGCIGTGAACTATTCSGTVIQACLNGRVATYDCAQQNMTCVSDWQGVRCAYGTDCVNAFDSSNDTCMGNVLTYCDAGRVATLDCVAAGWGRCENTYAHDGCAP